MSILLTGGSGRLGKQIKRLAPEIYAPTHAEMDILSRISVENMPKIEIIIHCAAYTDVASAEVDRGSCWALNVEGTKNVLNLAKNFSLYFVYISTACVFRGDEGNYIELDIPYPKNFYGLTKLIGEILVQNSDLKKWLIIRTNFVERSPWPYKKAFVDRWGTYLYADQVAEAILNLVTREETGIIHVCGKDRISMFDLAKIVSPHVEPLTLEEYYAQNPDAPPLTQDMSLKSIRIQPYQLI